MDGSIEIARGEFEDEDQMLRDAEARARAKYALAEQIRADREREAQRATARSSLWWTGMESLARSQERTWVPGVCECGATIADWDIPPYRGQCAPCQAAYDARRAAQEAERERLEREARRASTFGPARRSIPSRFAENRIDNPETRARVVRSAAIGEVEALLAGPLEALKTRPVVTFAGRTEAGKTTLAAAFLREIIERGAAEGAITPWPRLARGARFATAVSLGKARATHRLGDGDAPAVIAALEADVLLIDDFGTEPAHYSPALTEIVMERNNDERLTLVTTGWTSAQIEARYGAGVARRLCVRSSAHVILCADMPRRDSPLPEAD